MKYSDFVYANGKHFGLWTLENYLTLLRYVYKDDLLTAGKLRQTSVGMPARRQR